MIDRKKFEDEIIQLGEYLSSRGLSQLESRTLLNETVELMRYSMAVEDKNNDTP